MWNSCTKLFVCCMHVKTIGPLKKYVTDVFKTQLKDSVTTTSDAEQSDEEIQSLFDDAEIKYSQWTTTDHADLIQVECSLSEFIETFYIKIFDLKSHSYIAREQNAYLDQLKENLKPDEAVAILDFSENYNCVVQDEVQGFHWNNKQCSLHPVSIYYKDGDTSLQKSCCIVSDDLTHDVDHVHEVVKLTCKNVKAFTNNNVKKIHYFSDGCAAQYNCCKNFLNLCNHKAEFGIDAEWNFFATSHGKNTCDAIGGIVKRTVHRESLHRPVNSQILTAESLFDFCCHKLEKIKFEFVTKADLEKKAF